MKFVAIFIKNSLYKMRTKITRIIFASESLASAKNENIEFQTSDPASQCRRNRETKVKKLKTLGVILKNFEVLDLSHLSRW